MSTENKRQEKIDQIKTEFIFLIKNQESFEGYPIAFENTCNWLDCPDIYKNYITIKTSRENFNKRYLRNDQFLLEESKDENDLGKDFTMKKDKNSKMNLPWFSVDGFKTFCMIMKTEKSFLVRKYFIQIEKDYWRVLNQDHEKTKEELRLLEEKLKEENEKNINIINKLSDEKLELQKSNFCLTNIYNKAKTLEYLENDEEYAQNDIEKKYSFCLEKFMEKYNIPLYLVDYKEELKELLQNKIIPKIKKIVNKKPTKKEKDSESEVELDEEENKTKKKSSKQFDDKEIQNIMDHFRYMSNEENILEIPEDEMLNYLLDYYNLDSNEDFDYYPGNTSIITETDTNCVFSIKPTKAKTDKETYYPVGHLFIANKKHMNDLMTKLKDYRCPIFGESALYLPYNMLINNAKRAFVDKIYNEKLKEKNMKQLLEARIALEKY